MKSAGIRFKNYGKLPNPAKVDKVLQPGIIHSVREYNSDTAPKCTVRRHERCGDVRYLCGGRARFGE